MEIGLLEVVAFAFSSWGLSVLGIGILFVVLVALNAFTGNKDKK